MSLRRRGKPYSIYTYVPGKGKKLKKGVTVLITCTEDQQEASNGITPDSNPDIKNDVVQQEFSSDDSKVHVEPSGTCYAAVSLMLFYSQLVMKRYLFGLLFQTSQ